MDEEPDYMSDEFLLGCCNSSSDQRPGLIKSRKEQREHDALKKKRLSDREKRTKHEPGVVEGLLTPISNDNKGFLMLEKMGFKHGMGLGKKNTGIIEPIGIHVKHDRVGFGEAEARARRKQEYEKIDKERKEKLTTVDQYLTLVSNKQKEREIASDLRRSTRICRQLDLKSNVSEPVEIWFWPEDTLDNDGQDRKEKEEKTEFELSEKLEILTNYLRNRYHYCIWCGVQYADDNDLSDCPGPTRELH